jgi:DNA-directed RNA polymerase alpha subunit
MFDPAPDLPDDILIEKVRFPTIIRNALFTARLETIGDIRALSDDELTRVRMIGKGYLAYLRRTLGQK